MIPPTQVNSVSIAVLRESVVESAWVDWEREVVRHLEELISAEQELLKLLGQTHSLLARGDALAALFRGRALRALAFLLGDFFFLAMAARSPRRRGEPM